MSEDFVTQMLRDLEASNARMQVRVAELAKFARQSGLGVLRPEAPAITSEDYVSELAKYPALYPWIPVEAIASQQARAGYVD